MVQRSVMPITQRVGAQCTKGFMHIFMAQINKISCVSDQYLNSKTERLIMVWRIKQTKHSEKLLLGIIMEETLF